MIYGEEHIGRRVVYTGRNKRELTGVIQGVTQVGSGQFLDLKLDNSVREHFGVPSDTVVLVPTELEDTI